MSNELRTCIRCGKVFEVPKSSHQKYHSRECYKEALVEDGFEESEKLRENLKTNFENVVFVTPVSRGKADRITRSFQGIIGLRFVLVAIAED